MIAFGAGFFFSFLILLNTRITICFKICKKLNKSTWGGVMFAISNYCHCKINKVWCAKSMFTREECVQKGGIFTRCIKILIRIKASSYIHTQFPVPSFGKVKKKEKNRQCVNATLLMFDLHRLLWQAVALWFKVLCYWLEGWVKSRECYRGRNEHST